jgi:hypothetical protein
MIIIKDNIAGIPNKLTAKTVIKLIGIIKLSGAAIIL